MPRGLLRTPLKLLLTLLVFTGLGEVLLRVQLFGAAGLTYTHLRSIQKVLMSEFGMEPRVRRLSTVGSWGLRPQTEGINRGVPFRVNNLGFRGPDTTRAPRPGVYRIAVIGGSVTMGAGVREEHTWPAVLQEQLNAIDLPGFADQDGRRPRIEVINLAVPNTRRCLDRHLQRALAFQPHLVLWQVGQHTRGRILQRWLSECSRLAQERALPILAFERGVRHLRVQEQEHEYFQVLPALGVEYGPEHWIYPSDDHPDAAIHGRYAQELLPRLTPLLGRYYQLVQRRPPDHRCTWRPQQPEPWRTPEDGFWRSYLAERLQQRLRDLRLGSQEAWEDVQAMVGSG